MQIYLIRHGQQENRDRYSRLESLTPLGFEQADRLGRRLKSHSLVRIYASDLLRTVQTAEAISAHTQAPIELTPQLREIHFGEWEGLSKAEVEQRYAAFLNEFRQHHTDLAYPGGECGTDVRARAFAALDRIPEQNAPIAVVTHGGVILTVLCSLLGLGLEKRFHLCEINHCGLTRLERTAPGEYRIGCINDTAHLEGPV
jgi:broad specificity phosphatase PhoE